jgi:hypothetical protein
MKVTFLGDLKLLLEIVVFWKQRFIYTIVNRSDDIEYLI